MKYPKDAISDEKTKLFLGAFIIKAKKYVAIKLYIKSNIIITSF